jgi:diacylglycerol kinase (ATP)
MTAKVILNPYSNRWKAKARWPEAEAALKAAGIQFELAVSEYPGHPVKLAEEALRAGFSPIIVAGGDGTIGDVVNGMSNADPEGTLGPLGIIPMGTANDLFDSLGLPRDLNEIARVLAVGKTRNMDVCIMNERFFVNNSGVGFEPYVTVIQARIKWIKGMIRYLVAALTAVIDNPSWRATIAWDGGQYEGPISLATIGNSPRTGGLFYLSPHANLFDGKMTFMYGYRATRLGVLKLLPQTMQPEGKFVQEEGIREVDTTWIKIHLDRPSPVHTDGEIFPQQLTDFEYRILRERLKIIVP